MATKLYVFQFQFVIIVVIKQTLLHIKSFVIYIQTELNSTLSAQNRLGIWQSRVFVSGLEIHQKLVRFLFNPVHLLCINACFDGSIHILLCMQQFHSKTICEIKCEIAACIINVWGYTEI